MSTTIADSQLPVNAYVTQQTSQKAAATTSASSTASGTTNPSIDTITLSDMAQQMAAQAKSWASMSQSELKGIYDSTWNTFVQFDATFANQGNKVFYDDERTSGTPAELAFSKQIAAFMVSIHTVPTGNVANPYAGASREMLSSIMYDESGKFTKSERYAAAAEQGKQDYIFLSRLGDSAVRGTDQRKLYQGILDYYDAQSPVEKSVYPDGYREQTEAYLKQQETRFGVLSKKDVDSVKQVMSTAFNASTVSGSALTLTFKEPIWSQLVKITSSP
jgi:hypothetical protein